MKSILKAKLYPIECDVWIGHIYRATTVESNQLHVAVYTGENGIKAAPGNSLMPVHVVRQIGFTHTLQL